MSELQIRLFVLFLYQTYTVGTQNNRLNEIYGKENHNDFRSKTL